MPKPKNQKASKEKEGTEITCPECGHIDCVRGGLNCLYKNSKVNICSFSPCKLNLYDFAIHQQIIEHYVRQKQWDKAYFYFKGVMDKFPISCDLEDLKEVLKLRRTDPNYEIAKNALPLGCQLFLEAEDLTECKNINLFFYENSKEEISERGDEEYQKGMLFFSIQINKSLLKLNLMVTTKRGKNIDENISHQFVKEYFASNLEAAKILGITSKAPPIFEEAFEKAARGAGVLTEKHAEINKIKTIKAREVMEKEKLIEIIKKKLLSNEEISPEELEKLKKYGI